MPTRISKFWLCGGLLAQPGSALAQLTGTLGGVFTASSTEPKISFTSISPGGVTLNTGETVTPSYAGFGTWTNATASSFDTTIVFNNTKTSTNVAKAKTSGMFELQLTLISPVATTISLGWWSWAFDGATGVGDNKLDFQLSGAGSPATYVSGATNGGSTIVWKDNKSGGSFTVGNQAYTFTLYGGAYSPWDGAHPYGSLVNDAPLNEGNTFTVNAGFQINSVTTVPEPRTYALGATVLLGGAIGLRSLGRRRSPSGPGGRAKPPRPVNPQARDGVSPCEGWAPLNCRNDRVPPGRKAPPAAAAGRRRRGR